MSQNSNVEDDDVIATPWGMSSSVLNYSKRKVYIQHAPNTFANGNEIINRLIDYYCAIDINASNFEKLLSDKHAYYSIFHMDKVYHPATFSYFFSRDSLGLKKPYFTSLEKDDLVKMLNLCKKSDDLVMRYKVSYIVVPNDLNTSKQLKQYEYINIPGFKVYDIKAHEVY